MTLHITEIWGFSCLFHITMSDYQDFKVLFSFKCFRSENSLKLTLLSFTVIIPGTVDRPTESCDSDTGSDVHAPLRMNSDNSADLLWFRHQLTSHQIKTNDVSWPSALYLSGENTEILPRRQTSLFLRQHWLDQMFCALLCQHSSTDYETISWHRSIILTCISFNSWSHKKNMFRYLSLCVTVSRSVSFSFFDHKIHSI